jgi:hypothetical protein
MSGNRRAWHASILATTLSLMLALAGWGCGGDEGGGTEQPAATVVGAAGGEVDGPGKVTVSIPSGALGADTEITVEPASAPAVDDFDAAGSAYTFGPAGTTFSSPVTVELPYDAAAAGSRAADLTVWWADTAAGPWTDIGGTVDEAKQVVTAEVDHFSVGVVGLPACVPDCSGKDCGDDGCGGSCGTCGDAGGTDSGGADPGTSDDPGATDPGTSADPGATDPGTSADPGEADPGTPADPGVEPEIGAITGFAYLEGQTDHSGIRVEVQTTDLAAETIADGSFGFPELAAGPYTFAFSKEGFRDATATGTVIGGESHDTDDFPTLLPVAQPTPNPVAVHLGPEDSWFDFDTGEKTTNASLGDMQFAHDTQMGNDWLIWLRMHAAFENPDTSGDRDFTTFARVTDPSAYTLEDVSYAPEYGHVYIIKTSEGAFAKMVMTEVLTRAGTGAPSVSFDYKIGDFSDTTPPSMIGLLLFENRSNPSTGRPLILVEKEVTGGEIELTVAGVPERLQLTMDEYVDTGGLTVASPDRGNYHLKRTDAEGLDFDFDMVAFWDPHFKKPSGRLMNQSYKGIEEAGTYVITPNPLGEGRDHYFKDFDGNKSTTPPFEKVTIIYAP